MKRIIPFIAGGGTLFVLIGLIIMNGLSFQTTTQEPLIVQKTKASTVTYRKNVAVDQVPSIFPTTQLTGVVSSPQPTDALLAQNQLANKIITLLPTKKASTPSPTQGLVAPGSGISVSPTQSVFLSATPTGSLTPTSSLTKTVSPSVTGTLSTQLPKTGRYEYLIAIGIFAIFVITLSFIF